MMNRRLSWTFAHYKKCDIIPQGYVSQATQEQIDNHNKYIHFLQCQCTFIPKNV